MRSRPKALVRRPPRALAAPLPPHTADSIMETHADNGAAIEQDANGIITGWDATAERLFGWSRADVIGRQSDLLIPDRNANRHRHHLAEIVRGPEERTYERTITVRRCDGHEFPATVAVTPRSTPDGLRLIARVRAVMPLANGGEAQRYLAILNQISDGCAVVDLRGNYLFVNDPFCRMFNYRRDDLVGANFKSAIGEDRVNTLRAAYTEVYRTGRPAQLEYQVFPKGRDPMFIDQSVSLERDTDGRAVGFLSIMRDCNRRYPSARTRERAVYSNRGDDRPCDDRRSRQVSCRRHGWLRLQAAGPRGALPRRRILDGAIAITHTVSEPDARAGRAACVSGAHVALQRPPRSTQLTGFSRAITVFVRLVLGSRLAS